MVETKYFDNASNHSPPLVQAHIIPDLNALEPIGVHVVTIDGDAIPCEASFVSLDSFVEPIMPVDSSTQAWSAGIAGGVVGALVGGPFMGLATGGAAAYFSGKDGAAGDTARAMGECGRDVASKAKKLNEKHNLVDKSKDAAGSAWQKVKNLDRKHNLAKKGQETASAAWVGATEFNRKYGVIEKLGAFAALCFQNFAKFAADLSGRLLENGARQQQRLPQKTVKCY